MPDSDSEASHSDQGLAVGALVGIILGSVSVALILLLVLVVFIRKNKQKDTGGRASGASLSIGPNSGIFSSSISLVLRFILL